MVLKIKEGGVKTCLTPPSLWLSTPWRVLLAVVLVRHGQLLATMSATRSQYATAILGCHSLAETVLVHAAAVVRLKCSFHFIALFNLLLYAYYDSNEPNGPVWAAKLLIIFEMTKN